MHLRKVYKIITDRGKVDAITDFDWKNGERVVSSEGIEGSTDDWCFRSQVMEVCKMNGQKVCK